MVCVLRCKVSTGLFMQVRLAAVHQLAEAVRGINDRLVLLPELSTLIQRLTALQTDAAPQLPPAALLALAELLTAVGPDIKPYLG